MDERKGDARVYVVSFLFFACIVVGGVLLCLYIFLPQTNSASCPAQTHNPTSARAVTEQPHQPPPPAVATTTANTSNAESPVHSPVGERRVHFGAVIVLGNDEYSGQRELGHTKEVHVPRDDADKPAVGSRESEMPLTLSVSS
ncbi:hypothetical protein SLA2020_348530 [Shorea laevis]